MISVVIRDPAARVERARVLDEEALAIAELAPLEGLDPEVTNIPTGNVHQEVGYDPKERYLAHGELVGPAWQPKDAAGLVDQAGWNGNRELVEALSVMGAESWFHQRAYNDNISATTGKVLSRDCGLFQINIPASKIGSDEERSLFDDPAYNAFRAYGLYMTRSWQPWVAWNTGIAMSQEWWRWSGAAQDFNPTGRYLYRAMHGVRTYLATTKYKGNGGIVPFTFFLPPKPPIPST